MQRGIPCISKCSTRSLKETPTDLWRDGLLKIRPKLLPNPQINLRLYPSRHWHRSGGLHPCLSLAAA